MHALICLGNGKYYVSAVFGCYRDITYEEKNFRNPYWIVWNQKKTRLIRWFTFVPNTKSFIQQIIFIDADQSNWQKDENGVGCVEFLNQEVLDSSIDKAEQPEDILEK